MSLLYGFGLSLPREATELEKCDSSYLNMILEGQKIIFPLYHKAEDLTMSLHHLRKFYSEYITNWRLYLSVNNFRKIVLYSNPTDCPYSLHLLCNLEIRLSSD